MARQNKIVNALWWWAIIYNIHTYTTIPLVVIHYTAPIRQKADARHEYVDMSIGNIWKCNVASQQQQPMKCAWKLLNSSISNGFGLWQINWDVSHTNKIETPCIERFEMVDKGPFFSRTIKIMVNKNSRNYIFIH